MGRPQSESLLYYIMYYILYVPPSAVLRYVSKNRFLYFFCIINCANARVYEKKKIYIICLPNF